MSLPPGWGSKARGDFRGTPAAGGGRDHGCCRFAGSDNAARRRLEACRLRRRRRSRSGPLLHGRDLGHGRDAGLGRLDDLGPLWLRPGLHLCRDRGPPPLEERRHRRAWGDGLDPLQPHPGAAVAMVELARLDAGPGDRHGPGRRLSPVDLLRSGLPGARLAVEHPRSRLHLDGAVAAYQCDLVPGCGHHARGLRHPASRHPAHGADSDAAHDRFAAAALHRLHNPAPPGRCPGRELYALHSAGDQQRPGGAGGLGQGRRSSCSWAGCSSPPGPPMPSRPPSAT